MEEDENKEWVPSPNTLVQRLIRDSCDTNSLNCENNKSVPSFQDVGSPDISIKTDLVYVILFVFSSVHVVVIIVYEVYILCWSARTTPSRRHLFLGQMLLLGLLLGSSLGFAFAVDPSPASCVAVRLGTGMAYVLIYSSLLGKLVFLISLNDGVYLPATYQALLFLFCIPVSYTHLTLPTKRIV